MLVTNDIGDFLFLSSKDFTNWLEGKLDKKTATYKSLMKNNFIRDKLDETDLIQKLESRKSFLFIGPALHIIVVTLRCNQNCIYCHASAKGMKETGLDMDKSTINKTLDIIFSTPNQFIDIEFQGGEPLVNWPEVKYAVKEIRKRQVESQKEVVIKMVSNFILMTEDKYKFLIDKKVSLCTSLDGPRELHDRNRPFFGNSSYDIATKWIKRMNQEYPELLKQGYIWKPGAITTVSRFSLKYSKEIIDEYISLGYDTIFLRPINPFGLSKKIWQQIGYGAKEYIKFYLTALDYVIKKNLTGQKFIERSAKFYLQKILTDIDPNHMELRSPCGAGIGQLAYNYNGDVYTCDEGRMLSMMDDESFNIGNVKKNNYKDIVTHPVTRTLCAASCLEGLAGCSDCVYAPYCGTCPIYNYTEQGNIIGQMPTNDRCQINMAIFDYLFKKLEGKKIKKIFKEWLK